MGLHLDGRILSILFFWLSGPMAGGEGDFGKGSRQNQSYKTRGFIFIWGLYLCKFQS